MGKKVFKFNLSKKDIRLLVSIILIIVSFFLGFLFAKRMCYLDSVNNQKKQVNIEVMKTKLKITRNDPGIEVFVNGNTYLTGTVDIVEN